MTNMIKIIASMLLLILIFTAKNSSALEFNLSEGNGYSYLITIDFSQKAFYESTGNLKAESESIDIEGHLSLYLSITVADNQDDYADIICIYDSLHSSLHTTSINHSTNIVLSAYQDSLLVYQDDSLRAVYSAENNTDQVARGFYQKLLFIGEEIRMSVYPSGEIINISENKNLWQQASEYLNFPDQGFLQIQLPANIQSEKDWQQNIEINKLSDFKLKTQPDDLISAYQHNPAKNRFNFKGSLNLDSFQTLATLPDLDDQYNLTFSDFIILRTGTASYSGSKIVLNSLAYQTLMSGEILLEGNGLEKYLTKLILDYRSDTIYKLINSSRR